MLIDAHVHIGGPPPEAWPDNYAQLLKRSRIDKAVVFRYLPGQTTTVGNEFIRAAVSKYPDQLIGFAWVDPWHDMAASEVRTAVLRWKFKGIKLHLAMSPAPIDRLRPVFAEAESLGVPICVHLGDDFDSVDELSKEYNASIILAHMGTGVYNLDPTRLEKAIRLSKRNAKVYLETSGNTYFFIERAVEKLGPSKIIFGSDFPHEHPLVMAKAIELLNIPARDKELIFGENIANLGVA